MKTATSVSCSSSRGDRRPPTSKTVPDKATGEQHADPPFAFCRCGWPPSRLAVAGPSYAAHAFTVWTSPRSRRTGQVFTKPVSGSNNTTPSGASSNSAGIVTKPCKGVGRQQNQHQKSCQARVRAKAAAAITAEPACKIGGVEYCKSGVVSHGYCSPYPKVIVINKYPHHIPVYQNKYVPVPAGVASPVVSAPAAPATCLTKEYLPGRPGAVQGYLREAMGDEHHHGCQAGHGQRPPAPMPDEGRSCRTTPSCSRTPVPANGRRTRKAHAVKPPAR